MGIIVINIDKMTSKIYDSGTSIYHAIVREFGTTVLTDNKINHSKLSAYIAFNEVIIIIYLLFVFHNYLMFYYFVLGCNDKMDKNNETSYFTSSRCID